VQAHFETWLALARDGQGDTDAVPGYVEREFCRYLACGILGHGFARAYGRRIGSSEAIRPRWAVWLGLRPTPITVARRVANSRSLLIYNTVQRPAKPSTPVRFRPPPPRIIFHFAMSNGAMSSTCFACVAVRRYALRNA
jgi:hypothetical protein